MSSKKTPTSAELNDLTAKADEYSKEIEHVNKSDATLEEKENVLADLYKKFLAPQVKDEDLKPSYTEGSVEENAKKVHDRFLEKMKADRSSISSNVDLYSSGPATGSESQASDNKHRGPKPHQANVEDAEDDST